jgi:hypothetical protein
VTQQRTPRCVGRGQVRLQPFGHDRRMILGDVVEVIGHAPPHVLARVVLQGSQQRQRGGRIGHECLELHPPREAWATAFAHQSAHVRTRIVHPLGEGAQREHLVRDEKGTNRELGREPLCDRVQRAQRALRVLQPALRHELAGRPEHPPRESTLGDLQIGHLLADFSRTKRRLEHVGGLREIGGQRGRQCIRDLQRARLELEILEPARRERDESRCVERRPGTAEVRGGGLDQRRVEEVLERFGHDSR